MKKIIISLFIGILSIIFIPFNTVQAKEVNTLEVTSYNNKLKVKGTTEDGLLAVAVLVYSEDDLIHMETCSSIDNKYSCQLNKTFESGNYTVKVADYDGGNYISKNINLSQKNRKIYTINDDNNNSISFEDEEGHTFHLSINDFMKLTDEELESINMTKSDYDQIIYQIKNTVKQEGTLISFLDILITNENDDEIHDGPFKIKIKLTDEMKKYNSFKIINVNLGDKIETEDPIVLKKEGNYLVGTLDHLSTYALVGNKKASNPQTGDNIALFISLGLISLIGLFGVFVYTKKRHA